MNNLFGKLVDNLKSNKYLNTGIDTLKKNALVNKGIEVCIIAKDVYQQVKVEDEEKKRNLEDYYKDSKVKIQKMTPEEA